MKSKLSGFVLAIAGLSLLLSGCQSSSLVSGVDQAVAAPMASNPMPESDLLARSQATRFLGAELAHLEESSANQRADDVGSRLAVVAVKSNSIAQRLGLQPGDILVEINEMHVPKGSYAFRELAQRILPRVDPRGPVTATVIRNGYGRSLLCDGSSVAKTQPSKDGSKG